MSTGLQVTRDREKTHRCTTTVRPMGLCKDLTRYLADLGLTLPILLYML